MPALRANNPMPRILAPLAVSVCVEDPAWKAVLPNAAKLARAFARRAVAAALASRAASLEAAVVLADDPFIRDLNGRYRGKDSPTNVLSFPDHDHTTPDALAKALASAESPFYLGDIILARETVVREAVERGIPLAEHFAHLVVHGLLHLLSYDHETSAADAERMEGLETAILAAAGISDPYHSRMDRS